MFFTAQGVNIEITFLENHIYEMEALMKALEERILKDGQVRPGHILKVDSFLNHQMDIPFINEIGK